jgi:site-specific DNA-methyltransferase (adenine-specific)
MSTFTLERRDAFEALAALPPGSVDLAIFDPPYASLERHRLHPDGTPRGRVPRLTGWFPVIGNERLGELMAAVYRVMAKNSHCYVLVDAETLFELKPAGEAAGFKFWTPIVWNKEKIGMGYHYRNQYEFVAFFEKGKRKLFDLGVPNVISAKRIRGGYATEKPVSLLEVLVLQSSSEGELVLDPFMGSGSTGEAAVKNHRRFHGIDVQEKSFELVQARLGALGAEVEP